MTPLRFRRVLLRHRLIVVALDVQDRPLPLVEARSSHVANSSHDCSGSAIRVGRQLGKMRCAYVADARFAEATS